MFGLLSRRYLGFVSLKKHLGESWASRRCCYPGADLGFPLCTKPSWTWQLCKTWPRGSVAVSAGTDCPSKSFRPAAVGARKTSNITRVELQLLNSYAAAAALIGFHRFWPDGMLFFSGQKSFLTPNLSLLLFFLLHGLQMLACKKSPPRSLFSHTGLNTCKHCICPFRLVIHFSHKVVTRKIFTSLFSVAHTRRVAWLLFMIKYPKSAGDLEEAAHLALCFQLCCIFQVFGRGQKWDSSSSITHFLWHCVFAFQKQRLH